MSDQSRLSWALIVSVLLHGLLLTLLPFIRRAHLEIPPPASLFDIDLVQLPKPPPAPRPMAVPAPAPPAIPVPERQIVSPPDAGEEKEPAKARLLSDRNNTVKEETVHRDEPAAGDPDAKRQAPPRPVNEHKADRQPAPKAPDRPHPNTQLAALPKLDQLLPTAGDLIREGVVRPETAKPAEAPEPQASTQRTDLLRHGDPWQNRNSRGGTLDFLPAVREGDITLLNTKAEQFAPFVRRVAVRVFENFRILLRRSIDHGQNQAVQEFSTIEVVMDKQGRLVSITGKDRSGSMILGTDRILQAAVHEGFFDRNPPDGAEARDGNIHFLFDARVALFVQPGGVAGQAIFQAGLL